MLILLRLFVTWLVYVLIFMLAKPLFMLLNAPVYGWASMHDYLDVMWHGIKLDMGVAGYLTVIPTVISCIGLWLKSTNRFTFYAYRIYFVTTSVIIAAVLTLHTALYGFWGFPLDMTPIFYFSTSPSAALASVSWLFIAIGICATILLACIIYMVLRDIYHVPFCRPVTVKERTYQSVSVVLFLGLLIIPIRGGFTVSTLNLSAAYFSSHQSLNHAAINPAFSLLYSATHQVDFDRLAQYYEPEEAQSLFDELHNRHDEVPDSVMPVMTSRHPDIYMIIMESFSAQLMPSLGGDAIAVGVDSIARSGISFTNFYANGFRTDRGLPAILNGLPSPPATGVMKYPELIERMPSIAHELCNMGYYNSYYYGGDVNFANMNAFVVGSGFKNVVSDGDFPISQRMSKWGVHDGPLFERVLADIKHFPDTLRHFTVIQTSSSHEPFEVPASFDRFDGSPAAVNAFAYADSVITRFVNALRDSGDWDNTLVIMVADHWGAYPAGLTDSRDRHHIPLVMTGGVLKDVPKSINTYGSQVDIAPTLLAMMGLHQQEFPFGNNLFDPDAPHYGIYFDSDNVGMYEAAPDGSENSTVFNTDTHSVVESHGARDLSPYIKAYLQILYDRMGSSRKR